MGGKCRRLAAREDGRVKACLGARYYGLLLAVVVVVAGCTGQSGSHGPTDLTTSSAPVTASGSAGGFGTRHVTLTCAEAAAASAADASGLTDRDILIGALGAQTGSVPRAEDVGLRLPPGLHWYFRKGPLVMKAGAIEVTIAASGLEQALAWVPSAVWTSGPDLGSWASASVTLQSCPDRNALFLGGILAANPDTCLQLQVSSAGREDQTFRQHLDGSACPR
jgi:hypothetical protein